MLVFRKFRSSDSGGHTVDLHLAMSDDRLDHALLLEVGQALTSERTVDLHSVDEGGDGDETVRLHILVELLGSGLVEDDGVLGLVLDLSLGPEVACEFQCRRRRLARTYHFFFCFFAPAAGACKVGQYLSLTSLPEGIVGHTILF